MPITLAPGVAYQLDVTLVPLPAELFGNVTSAATGAPISGASIQLVGYDNPNNYQATTDVDGYYDIQGIAPGQYDVTVSASGYNPATR